MRLSLAEQICHSPEVTKLPDYIAVSPISLVCPRCKAKPGKVCHMLDGAVELVHIERIKAAAAMDVRAKKAREKLL
jgi:hypothetical protein